MGFPSRYAAALLSLILTPQAFSAVRVPVTTNDAYIKEVLSRQTAATGAISTPAGDVEFFGPDKVYAFSAGDSVKPTIREVKPLTVGSVSYPYGPGAAYPNDPALSPGAATKVKVKPKIVVPKTNISTGLKSLIKLNPLQVALGAATSAAIAGVGWVMSDDQTKLQKKKDTVGGLPVSGTGDFSPQYICGVLPASQTMGKITVVKSDGVTYAIYVGPYNTAPSGYQINNNCTQSNLGYWYNADGYWPQSSHKVISVDEIVSLKTDLTDSDFSALDPWVSSQTAPFLHDLLKDVCNGSTSPSRCYADMEDRSKRSLAGPATVAGPWFTRTSTFPNPDGSTSTKTETTSTKFDLTYGPSFFDVDTERKTTTEVDGVPQGETTEKDQTPIEDVESPDHQEEEEPSYTFNDSALPAVDPFYVQKYPDGFQGVWNSAKSDFDQSAFVSFLNSFIPSFSGSCPAFSMSFAIGNFANFGTHGFGNLCYALDFVKVCIMLGALFLCRAIVFGG